MDFAPFRFIASFGLFALLALGACKAGSGDACKEENDCSGSLVCCKAGSASTTARGVCQATCESVDAGTDSGTSDSGGLDSGGLDSGVDSSIDSGSEDDAGEDAGAEDAGTDAGEADAGTDAGEADAGTDAGEDAGTEA